MNGKFYQKSSLIFISFSQQFLRFFLALSLSSFQCISHKQHHCITCNTAYKHYRHQQYRHFLRLIFYHHWEEVTKSNSCNISEDLNHTIRVCFAHWIGNFTGKFNTKYYHWRAKEPCKKTHRKYNLWHLMKIERPSKNQDHNQKT